MEKFSPENLNYIYTVDPYQLKFFDESGIRLPALEISQDMKSPKITLNLLCGLDGIIYANTIDGTSNSITFLNFFYESINVFLPDSKPPYNYGDHIIMDNAPIHHNRAGEALGEWRDDIGCTLVYLPTYSPEFNPAELVFNKLKTILKRFGFRELLQDNLHVAVYEAVKQ